LKGFSDFATDGEVNLIVSLSTFLNNTEKILVYTADQQCLVDKVTIGSIQWRNENVIMNITFWYPF
jgi:hypothetical protein